MTGSPASHGRCAICGKPAEQQFRPFCSRRCADVDLHRWLAGSYTIPAVESDEDEEPAEAEPVGRRPRD
jgi:endogenous inhibitor of DNA gyrase (YacG/DUF329 family)